MLSLKEAFEEYHITCKAKNFSEKTMINKNQEAKQLMLFLKEKRGITQLNQISIHDMKAYLRFKQQSELKPQSVVAIAKMIKAFFNWCIEEEHITENPLDKVDLPKVPKKILEGFTEQDVANMINAFSFKTYIEARNKALISVMCDTGMRSSEIRGLKDVQVKDESILVDGKGNKERIVFISPALKRILIKYERLKRSYFKDKIVFDNYYFLTYQGNKLSHVSLDNVVKLAGERAGVKGVRVSPHTFRHFYSVQAITKGQIDVYSLSRLLGHSDISTTQRYLESLNHGQLLDKAISSSPLMNLHKK